jgi:hypothetical protein
MPRATFCFVDQPREAGAPVACTDSGCRGGQGGAGGQGIGRWQGGPAGSLANPQLHKVQLLPQRASLASRTGGWRWRRHPTHLDPQVAQQPLLIVIVDALLAQLVLWRRAVRGSLSTLAAHLTKPAA